MSRTIRRREAPEGWWLPWQHTGRCEQCSMKITGRQRVRVCVCGGRVSYR